MINANKIIGCNAFIDIDKNIAIFKALVDNNQNITIKTSVRFKKRLLIKSAFQSIGRYDYIYTSINKNVDLKLLSSDILKDLKKINIDKIPLAMINRIKDNLDGTEQFLCTLDVIEEIAQKKKINIKFVFDEFQDILNNSDKKILDKCRSVMQHHQNITYIFIGSNKSVMTKIFENYSSPFFHFTRVLTFYKSKKQLS